MLSLPLLITTPSSLLSFVADLTIRLTDKAQIAARLRAFDSLFEDAQRYTLKLHGTGPDDRDVHGAVIRGIHQLLDDLGHQT